MTRMALAEPNTVLTGGTSETSSARFRTSTVMFSEDRGLFRRSGCWELVAIVETRGGREGRVWYGAVREEPESMSGHFVSGVGLHAIGQLPRFFPCSVYLPFRFPRRNVRLIDRRFGVPQSCPVLNPPCQLRYSRYIEALARYSKLHPRLRQEEGLSVMKRPDLTLDDVCRSARPDQPASLLV